MQPVTPSSGFGRYAPTPSGHLHLGNLRTALAAHLLAKASGRDFLVRIEDLDRQRDAGTGQAQLEQLKQLGITWNTTPVKQSERLPLYGKALTFLREAGLCYECFCTRKDIAHAASAPNSPPGAYPGTCRNMNATEIRRQRMLGRKGALRLKTPDTLRTETFTDLVLGTQTGIVDDFVLCRADGTFAYNLAVVVDDAAQNITQVTRGADLASSTPRQIVLQKLLGTPQPEYWHVSLVLGAGGARLAKRDGAITPAQLQEKGFTHTQIKNYLAATLGQILPGNPPRFKNPELIKKPVTFTAEQLKPVN